jgi:Zn-dependent metalloprotease
VNRPPRLLSLVTTAALAVTTLGVVSASEGAAATDARSAAVARLKADADGSLTIRSSGGVYDFVGVPADVEVDNPAVSPSTSVAAAADAAIARYGPALGTKQAGTRLTAIRAVRTVAGDVVRYQQKVGGLPVVAGEVVVSLRQDRELDSILAKTSRATKVAAPRLTEAEAAAKAQASFQKQAGTGAPATVSSKGRWVLDGSIVGASADVPVRTVYRFELTRGADERRLVLVDDQTGAALVDSDMVDHVKRIVCDNNQVLQNPNVANAACTDASANKVRGEGDPAAALAEANTAYDLAAAMQDGYAAMGIPDLTDLIGRDIGAGVKALSQTVRWCYTGYTCPYANAFWNGAGMYYGTGYATADDVIGHEMGHGVTERSSNLVYWGQSGAINESLSDIFGEIIDHRNVGPGDTATSFQLGEDLPIGAIRSMSNPPSFGDPDRTGSANYVKETCPSSCYGDEDGVHSNSGVGNKTFYLASQGTGGTPFNGVTIPTGIDAGDPNLTKSGKLWLLTDQSLTSGSDYADLGVTLAQSCAALQAASVVTAGDCAIVAQAVTATELAVTPTNNPQPADALATCPAGTSKQVLFDSETGTPASKFTAGTGWSRNGTADWGQIAHSAPDAWSNQGTSTASSRALTVATPIALPAGQPAYLHFQQWRVLEYSSSTFYDGGQVAINGASTAAGTWINGPSQTIATGGGNLIPGQLAFGGDSRGYLASRLDLSSYAGTSVTPSFTLYSDGSTYYLGWWLDDISVYTCVTNAAPVVNAGPDGAATVGSPFASSGSFTDDAPAGATATVDYGDGSGVHPLALAGTTFNLSHTYSSAGAKTVTVTVTDAGSLSDSDTATVTVSPASVQAVTAGTVTVKGKLLVGKKLKAKVAGWLPAGVTYTYQWLRNGKVISGATERKYKTTKKDKGKKLSVTVVGSKPGYTSATVTSAKTGKIKNP